MTPYAQGFLTKCAERGLTEKQALSLLDVANNPYLSGGAGALGGAALAGLGTAAFGKKDEKTGKKKYLRNMILGALGGGALGGAAGAYGKVTRKAYDDAQREFDTYMQNWRVGQNKMLPGMRADDPGDMADFLEYQKSIHDSAVKADRLSRFPYGVKRTNNVSLAPTDWAAPSKGGIGAGFGPESALGEAVRKAQDAGRREKPLSPDELKTFFSRRFAGDGKQQFYPGWLRR